MIQRHNTCAKTTLLAMLARLIFSSSVFTLPVLLLLMALPRRQCLIPSATHTHSREREEKKATATTRFYTESKWKLII
jgi:hypothetical protein